MSIAKKPNLDQFLPTTRVSDDLYQDFVEYCEKSDQKGAQVVRKAVSQYLARLGERRRPGHPNLGET